MSKRSKSKYPGLDQKVNLKIRKETMDQDYIDKLSEEEKKWLSNFMEEYNSANFDHPGKRIHPKQFITKKVKKTGKKRKVDVMKKDCEDRNNHRNADAYSVTKINNMLKGENKISKIDKINRSTNYNEVEDTLITIIDLKNEKESKD